jgi:crotonobetainyl-CoA:carnitine CoA-transferase CaiB-like acyl-CoA transferase
LTVRPREFRGRRRASASTAAILAELGLNAVEIERLAAEKVVRLVKT